jgi:hypothetical protein
MKSERRRSMRNRRAVAVGLAVATLAIAAGVCHAQVPQKMNYQVMLTDAANQPLASQSVQLVFRIYTLSAGGSQLWNETQNVTTNSIGVVSVILGSVTPLTVDFSTSRWLQVEVNGETMTPRRELVAAPYARQAHNADNLGGTAAGSFALSSTLSTAGTINSPGNPVDWTKLKSVPAGFADGTDNAGLGDGNSLDAPDGDPVNALYVENDGDVVVGSPTPTEGWFEITPPRCSTALRVNSQSYFTGEVSALATCDSTSAIVGNVTADMVAYSVPLTPTGVAGIGYGVGNGGFFLANGSGMGADCRSAGAGAAVSGIALGSGYSGHFEGGAGVDITRSNGYPVLNVHNTRPSSFADGGWFESGSGVSGITWTVYSHCFEGRAGFFQKSTDDNYYALHVTAASASSEGLYVQGTLVYTGLAARAVPTSRGNEAVFGVTAVDVDVMASGSGALSAGAARVEFDRLFAESISGAADLRVTATPIGAWSALYVERIDAGGFTLRSDAGDRDVAFNWVAVGRAKGYERTPEIAIPDPAEDARVAAEKRAAVEAARPPRGNEGPATVTRTLGE